MDDYEADDKNDNLNQCDIFKIMFLKLFFGETPTGASYVDMDRNNLNKDDLTMLCEHG